MTNSHCEKITFGMIKTEPVIPHPEKDLQLVENGVN